MKLHLELLVAARYLGADRRPEKVRTLRYLTLGLMLAQAAQTGRPIGNRRVPITRGDGSGVFVALLSVDILEPLNSSGNAAHGTGLLVRLRDPEAARQVGRQLQTGLPAG